MFVEQTCTMFDLICGKPHNSRSVSSCSSWKATARLKTAVGRASVNWRHFFKLQNYKLSKVGGRWIKSEQSIFQFICLFVFWCFRFYNSRTQNDNNDYNKYTAPSYECDTFKQEIAKELNSYWKESSSLTFYLNRNYSIWKLYKIMDALRSQIEIWKWKQIT